MYYHASREVCELEPGQNRVEVLFIIFPPVGSHKGVRETEAAGAGEEQGQGAGGRQTHSKPLAAPGF